MGLIASIGRAIEEHVSAIDFLLDPHAVAVALHSNYRDVAKKLGVKPGPPWDELSEPEKQARLSSARLVVCERLASLDEEEEGEEGSTDDHDHDQHDDPNEGDEDRGD